MTEQKNRTPCVFLKLNEQTEKQTEKKWTWVFVVLFGCACLFYVVICFIFISNAGIILIVKMIFGIGRVCGWFRIEFTFCCSNFGVALYHSCISSCELNIEITHIRQFYPHNIIEDGSNKRKFSLYFSFHSNHSFIHFLHVFFPVYSA